MNSILQISTAASNQHFIFVDNDSGSEFVMHFGTMKYLVLLTCYNSDTANMNYLVNTHLKQYHLKQFFLIELYARLEEILFEFRKLQNVQRILLKTFDKLSIPYILYFLIRVFFNYRECVIFFFIFIRGPN